MSEVGLFDPHARHASGVSVGLRSLKLRSLAVAVESERGIQRLARFEWGGGLRLSDDASSH